MTGHEISDLVLELGFSAMFAGWLIWETAAGLQQVRDLVRERRAGQRRRRVLARLQHYRIGAPPGIDGRIVSHDDQYPSPLANREIGMQLRFLCSTSEGGACPTVYDTDEDAFVVQGELVTDPSVIAGARDVLPGEAFVKVPRALLLERFREARP